MVLRKLLQSVRLAPGLCLLGLQGSLGGADGTLHPLQCLLSKHGLRQGGVEGEGGGGEGGRERGWRGGGWKRGVERR